MGNLESIEKEKTKQAIETTKQLEIKLQTARFEAMSKALQKQQEVHEKVAVNKKFSIVHGGVTIAEDGTPRLDQSMIVADDVDGLQVCKNYTVN